MTDFVRDRRAHDPAHQLLTRADEIAHIKHFARERLLTRVRAQHFGELLGARGVVGDFLQRRIIRIADRVTAQQIRTILHDNGQEIVEVVRDASGEFADLAHLLRLRQARLEFALLADIGDVSNAPPLGGAREIDVHRRWRLRRQSNLDRIVQRLAQTMRERARALGRFEQISERSTRRRAALRHFHQRRVAIEQCR